MADYDDLIHIDGSHTMTVRQNRNVIIPAEEVYEWRAGETAPAWPMHQERGAIPASPAIREHHSPPNLPAPVASSIVWNPAAYERAVSVQLDNVFAKSSGAAIRRLMTEEYTIMPFPIRDPTNIEGNYRPNAAPRARAEDRSLYVIYTPGHFLRDFRASSLFHELVHIYRIMIRVYRPRAQARDPYRYTMWEEFPAVCVENVFRSESGLPLRWGHYNLTRVLGNPDTWLDSPHNRSAVERLISEMDDLTRALAAINTRFNPFRAIRGPG